VVLLAVVFLVGLASPLFMRHFDGAATGGRIAVAVALLSPLGVVMGMPFPLGMRRADELSQALSPWLWGINGAASVCASVLAVVIALSVGIGASYWVGMACYVLAAAIYAFWMTRGPAANMARAGGALQPS
jgi:hypothetical protein